MNTLAVSEVRLLLALKLASLSHFKVGKGLFIPSNSASVFSTCKMLPGTPFNESRSKDDSLGSDRPSAAAAAWVRRTCSSLSSCKVLCVIPETSLFTAAAQQSTNSRWRAVTLLNRDNTSASFSAPTDVNKQVGGKVPPIFKEHVLKVGIWSRS